MLSRILKLLTACLIILGSGGVIYLSNQSFFLAQGRDGPVFILSPAIFGQVVGWVVLSFVIMYTVASPVFQGWFWRPAALIVGALFFLLASHHVVTDIKHGEIRDVWLLWTAQKLTFEPKIPPTQSLQLFKTNFIVFLNSRDNTLYLVPGFFPLNLNYNVLEAQWRGAALPSDRF